MENVRQDRVLAEIIKGTHAKLRETVKGDKENSEKIWANHVERLLCNDTVEYANAMKKLSNDYWKNESRLSWISDKLNLYFVEEDCLRFLKRLHRRKLQSCVAEDIPKRETQHRFRILDVGSCHNPLKKTLRNEHLFDIFAMDLSPAENDVFQGDFLQVELGEHHIVHDNQVKALREKHFDAVVFCLLLEYLPCPKLRLKAVKKAISLMQPFGILLIVTPDSSHQGKNMNQMKSWRRALAKLGMLRIYVEKLTHVHCLGYVKVEPKSEYEEIFHKEIAFIESKMKHYPIHLDAAFYIPQD